MSTHASILVENSMDRGTWQDHGKESDRTE